MRYYLLREIPSYEDGDFSLRKFEDRYSADLANGLGNLVARIVTLGEKNHPSGSISFDFGDDIIDMVKKRVIVFSVNTKIKFQNSNCMKPWGCLGTYRYS